MKLTNADVGKKFNTESGEILTGIAVTPKNFITVNKDGFSHSHRLNGDSDEFKPSGVRYTGLNIKSRYDPRSWLADMPNLGDIKEGWIAWDGEGWLWCNTLPVERCNGWGVGLGSELTSTSICQL